MLRIRSFHRAFTLVELLTVIAILAFLAVLIVPQARRMQDSARQGKCLSNLKQIGVAVILYVNDHNGEFPHLVTGDPAAPTTHSSVWSWDLDPYIPHPRSNPAGASDPCPPVRDNVFFCPAAKKERSWFGTEPDYGPNGMVFTSYSGTSFQPTVKLMSMRNPGRCLMIADSCVNGSISDGAYYNKLNWDKLTNISADCPSSGLAPRHGYDGKDARTGRFGALFCDGHAEMFSYGDPRLLDADFRRDFLEP